MRSLPALLATPVTVPASWAYGWLIRKRNQRFDRGAGVHRLNVPVISVGNLTMGGTGKTPIAAWIAQRLIEVGREPVIAMRGYGADVRNGQSSDEQAEYRDLLPQTHVVADPDRTAALSNFLPAHPQVQCVILDDGFQHRQLHRDLNIVLIDAQAETFVDRLLPAGRLREPLRALQRADAVIITRAESEIPSLRAQVQEYHGNPPLAWSNHHWAHLALWEDPRGHLVDVGWLAGKRVITMLGVGNPGAVQRQLERAGATILANIPAADHERYDSPKLMTARGLCAGADALVVTGKDWVKLRILIDLAHWPCPIVVPRVEMRFLRGERELLNRVLVAAGCAKMAAALD